MVQSLSQLIYERIKHEIITCELQPGQQIAQPQLAERLNAGITPIREALQRLAQEGLVQAIPRFGYIVTSITLADVVELYETRSILESAAARLAAIRATNEQLENIDALSRYTYVYRDHGSYTDFLKHNTEFHRAVAFASGNAHLTEWISQLLDKLMRVFHLGLDLRDSAEEMRSEHRVLSQALIARDAVKAERIVLEQISRSQQRVMEALVQKAGSPTLTAPERE